MIRPRIWKVRYARSSRLQLQYHIQCDRILVPEYSYTRTPARKTRAFFLSLPMFLSPGAAAHDARFVEIILNDPESRTWLPPFCTWISHQHDIYLVPGTLYTWYTCMFLCIFVPGTGCVIPSWNITILRGRCSLRIRTDDFRFLFFHFQPKNKWI